MPPCLSYCESLICATLCSRARTSLNASGAAAKARPMPTPMATFHCGAFA